MDLLHRNTHSQNCRQVEVPRLKSPGGPSGEESLYVEMKDILDTDCSAKGTVIGTIVVESSCQHTLFIRT